MKYEWLLSILLPYGAGNRHFFRDTVLYLFRDSVYYRKSS